MKVKLDDIWKKVANPIVLSVLNRKWVLCLMTTLPETNIAPENEWLEY